MSSGNHKITYTCGHGESVVNISGEPKTRLYKLGLMQKDWVCPACYQAEREANRTRRDMEAPRVLNVIYEGEKVYLLPSGNLSETKEEWQRHGYKWSRLNLIGLNPRQYSGPPLLLHRVLHTWDGIDLDKWLASRITEATALGYTAKVEAGSREGWIERQAVRIDHIRALKASKPEPAQPSWWQAMRDAAATNSADNKVSFNSMIYGGRGNRHIYLNGEQFALTDAQAAELEAWLPARSQWRAWFDAESRKAV